jgi:cobalt-zinc-cadmium efflux system membrane fusion protein
VQAGTGEGVAAMSTIFVIDRQDRIQVEAVMPANLAGRVVEGAPAVVEGVEGKVVAVGAAIDPKTRSLSVRVEAPPRAGFIPGRATRIELYAPGAAGLSIPRAALTTLDGRTVAFVRSAAGFSAQPIQVLGYAGDMAVIAAGGLRSDTQVAVAGVSELKARSAP